MNATRAPIPGLTAVLCALFAVVAVAAPPPDLPGEEIPDELMRQYRLRDTTFAKSVTRADTSVTWLEQVMETWIAPPLTEQMGQDDVLIPMGQGAVFVPRMSEQNLEPDISLFDSTGESSVRAKPGQTLLVMPGRYSVVFGSGTHRQQIVRQAEVIEGRVTPVMPDWAGLSIEVVNENGIQFDGAYELVRMDDLELYGRGLGADPDLGESPQTWILKPGLYKILSVGESYNTLRNFITIRLLPGMFTKVLLNMNENSLKIQGGGVIEAVTFAERRNKVWSAGVDLGGSILFNAEIDRLSKTEEDRASNSTTIALLMNAWLRYEKKPFEWQTSLRLDEGFTAPNFDFSLLESSIDDLRLRSLFVWRVLRWLGPYGRLDAQTDVMPKYARRSDETKFFFIVDESGTTATIDEAGSARTEASFSPLNIATGVGANADIFNRRVFETRFRIGFGYGYTSVHNKYEPVRVSDIDTSVVSPPDTLSIDDAMILQARGDAQKHEAGPEAALTVYVRLGSLALARLEARVFAPVAPEVRFNAPDLDLEMTLSWRLVRSVTMDYEFSYMLKQPPDEEFKRDQIKHGIRLRYSLRTR